MKNLIKRSTSGLVYVALFIGATLYSKESFILLITLFGLICIGEFGKLVNSKSIFSYLLLIGFSVLILSGVTSFQGIPIVLAVSFTGLLQVSYYLFSKKTINLSGVFQKEDLSVRYVVLGFVILLFLPFIQDHYNPNLIVFLLLLIWTNDSFAFVVGVNFGKTKLFESVSPKKTIEGFLGGMIFTIIVGVIIAITSELFSILDWVILSIIVSVLGTVGDLIESKFKRQANSKDSGTIMPGHGGMLDRLDSLLFVVPFVYLYIHYII